MNEIGKGIASLGICAVIGLTIWRTGDPDYLWALLVLWLIW